MSKSADVGRFDPDCTDCPRLAQHLAEVRHHYPAYHARPVAGFGSPRARLLIVGLAPGMHGANRTGRPFTGDYAGILLYGTLHRFGLANHEGSDQADDGLKLIDCRVTNAVKCLPPENKPEPDEIRRCNRFLAAEFAAIKPCAVLALGVVAHRAVLMACGLKQAKFSFAHHAKHALPANPALPDGALLLDSYHCSRYNTQTRRLTENMFAAVVRDIAKFLSAAR